MLLVNRLLQPLTCDIPGYLKDTKRVMSVVEAISWQNNYVWITADVTSLYTGIPLLIWYGFLISTDIYSTYSNNLN